MRGIDVLLTKPMLKKIEWHRHFQLEPRGQTESITDTITIFLLSFSSFTPPFSKLMDLASLLTFQIQIKGIALHEVLCKCYIFLHFCTIL